MVAGTAAPGSRVTILADEEPLAEVRADDAGNFVAIFNAEPSAVPRTLSLDAVAPDGQAATSDDVVMLLPPRSHAARGAGRSCVGCGYGGGGRRRCRCSGVRSALWRSRCRCASSALRQRWLRRPAPANLIPGRSIPRARSARHRGSGRRCCCGAPKSRRCRRMLHPIGRWRWRAFPMVRPVPSRSGASAAPAIACAPMSTTGLHRRGGRCERTLGPATRRGGAGRLPTTR